MGGKMSGRKNAYDQGRIEHWEYDKLYKIVIIGDSNTGKTCLQRCFVGEEFEDMFIPTIGVDFRIRNVELDGVKIKLQLWDTAGQERFRTIIVCFYGGAAGVIITYNVTKGKTFDNVAYWIEHAKKFVRPDIKLMMVGTGCDCEGRAVDYTTARDFADEHQLSFFEVCAKDGTNVELAFMTFAEEIRQSLSTPK